MLSLGDFCKDKLPSDLKSLGDFFVSLGKESKKLQKEVQKICDDQGKDEEGKLEAIAILYGQHLKLEGKYVNSLVDVAGNAKVIQALPKRMPKVIEQFKEANRAGFADVSIKAMQRLPQIVILFQRAAKEYPQNETIGSTLEAMRKVSEHINQNIPK